MADGKWRQFRITGEMGHVVEAPPPSTDSLLGITDIERYDIGSQGDLASDAGATAEGANSDEKRDILHQSPKRSSDT